MCSELNSFEGSNMLVFTSSLDQTTLLGVCALSKNMCVFVCKEEREREKEAAVGEWVGGAGGGGGGGAALQTNCRQKSNFIYY